MGLPRKENTEFVQRESILDTMMNIIGILIIVAALTQISVGGAMKKIIKVENVGAAKKLNIEKAEAKKLLKKLAVLSEWRDVEKEPMTAEDEALIAKYLSQKPDKQASVLAALRELRVGRAKLLKDVVPPKELRLPDPHSPGAGMKMVEFVVRKQRIHPFEYDKLLERGHEELQKLFPEQLQGKNRREAQKDVLALIADPDNRRRIEKHFQDNDKIGDAYYRLLVAWAPTNPADGLAYVFKPRKDDQGEGLEQLRQDDSLYARAVEHLERDRHWVFFHVWDDSLYVFTMARLRVENKKLLSGWGVFASDKTANPELREMPSWTAYGTGLKPFNPVPD
jgi:hypothetical protein